MAIRWPRTRKPPKPRPSAPWVSYCRSPDTLAPGNRIDLLVDGAEAYPSMLEAIRGAERTILMASYIFHDDEAGRLFADALVERARAGVEVYLIVDGMGALYDSVDFFKAMEAGGVQLLIYRSPAPWRRSFGLFKRDHRKLLVVDGSTGFTGGINIGREWLPADQGGEGWHDIHVRVIGPVVRELAKLAIATWQTHGDPIPDPHLFLPRVPVAGTEYAAIISSRERKQRAAIRRAYLHAIKRARDTIYIANAYFLPDFGFQRALANAVKRGVDVRIMVPGRSDIRPVQYASQALFGRMLRAGVRLFSWKEAILHAKTAVIDGQWCTVGSFNIDHRSWTMNLEVNLNAVGPALASRLKALFLRDQERCEELTAEGWRRRPWFQRLLERFFYQFMRFF